MAWTDERVEILKKLWAEGLSASQIASELGGVTRNAVIGKVHRLGLSGRGKTSAASPRTRQARTQTPSTKPVNPGTATIGNAALKLSPETQIQKAPQTRSSSFKELVIPFGERANIMDLTEHTCRWPIGDPTSKDFHFCGKKTEEGIPYCTYHKEVAYQNSTDKRQKKVVNG